MSLVAAIDWRRQIYSGLTTLIPPRHKLGPQLIAFGTITKINKILLFCQGNILFDVGLKTIGEGDSTGKSKICARVSSETYDYLLLQPDVDLCRSQKTFKNT